ncbi:chemerin-like receptor 1 [Anolis sagrei]|uniref:chemerin-like receptor 1 n=1 Tax=Anolis sagrei TaxID=38937 RepID=UPI0035218C71
MENTSRLPDFTLVHGNATLPYESVHFVVLQRSMHLLSIAIYGISCILGVIGNGLVLWIAGFRMKTRTVSAVWLLNLAVADFVFTFFLPLSIAYTALGFHWPFGKLLCKLNSAAAFLNMFASVFLLTVISVDRCVSVVWPIWCRNHRTPRAAFGVVVATWTAAFALSSPYFVFRDTALTSHNITSCFNNFALSDNYDTVDVRQLYQMRHQAMVVTRFLLGFAFPFAAITICYGVVASRLKRRRLTKSSKPFRIIIAVTASFFLCYFPYHVFSLLEMTKASASPQLKMALYLGIPLASSLAFFNSCINPILYVFVGQKRFRQSVLAAFEGAFGEDFIFSLSSKRKSRSISQAEIQMT